MSFQALFWSIVAIAFLVGIPVIMLGSARDYLRGKGSQRRGGGGMSAAVGAALQELDRLAARPSVEHQIEAQRHSTKRDDDTDGQ
jgi:hypothetical protein